MNSLKKSSYFTKVEDKYVFKVSTAFWHLLIGFITLVAVAGIIIFFWSIIPPSKKTVNAASYPQKPVFPTVEKVAFSELNLTEEKVKTPPVEKIEPIPVFQPPKQQIQEDYDPDKPAYNLVLGELRKIIPENQWEPGRWEITNELGWEMYHSDQYRKWIPSGSTIENYLESIYQNIKVKKYADKKKTLESVTKIVRAFPVDKKGVAVEYIYYSVNPNWSDLKMFDSLCTIIANNLNALGQKPSDAIERMIQFGFNEPNAAFDFIPFAIKITSQFSDSLRSSVFVELISSYYNYFNRNLDVQKDATQQFSELIPQLNKIDPAKALKKFYSVYNQKNKRRSEEIEHLMEDYYAQINSIVADSVSKALQAQMNYNEKKRKKSDLRWKSLQAIGGGFVAIALLGTVLTLLSIQRILKRIEIVSEKGLINNMPEDSTLIIKDI